VGFTCVTVSLTDYSPIRAVTGPVSALSCQAQSWHNVGTSWIFLNEVFGRFTESRELPISSYLRMDGSVLLLCIVSNTCTITPRQGTSL
jgi:hypothetical protein